jgi:hypothetical protein
MRHRRRMSNAPKLSPHEERVVGVYAGCDPRTVRARLAGKPQHSTVAARIDRALVELGFVFQAPESPPPPSAACATP